MNRKPTLSVKHLIFILLFFNGLSSAWSQYFKFENHGIQEGINPFVYSINQDKYGYLLVATGEGLYKYNGFSFTSDFKELKGLSFVTFIFKDNEKRLWLGHNGGGISMYNGKRFINVLPDTVLNSTIKGITSDYQGNLYFASQNKGIVKISPDQNIENIKEGIEEKIIYSIHYIGKNFFLLGSTDGLEIYSLDNQNNVFQLTKKVNGISSTVQCIQPGNTGVFIGTEDEGFFKLNSKNNDPVNSIRLVNMGSQADLGSENVQWIVQDNDNNTWIATYGSGVYRLIWDEQEKECLYRTRFFPSNGLPSVFVRHIFIDNGGNTWIGTFGKGLARMVDESFSRITFKEELIGPDVTALAINDGFYWIGANNGILQQSITDTVFFYFGERHGLPDDKITCLHVDENQNVYAGTSRNGVYRKRKKSNYFYSYHKENNSLENAVTSLCEKNDTLWISTWGGVFSVAKRTLNKKHYSTDDGLPHNVIRKVYIDSENSVWIGTRTNGLYSLNQDKTYNIPIGIELEINAIVEDHEKNLWIGTYGNGIYKFSSDSLFHYTTEDGLKSNYIYSLIVDKEGRVWSGHRMGLTCVDTYKGIIQHYGLEVGIAGDCNTNAVVLDPFGRLLFGTTEGIIFYDPSKENKNKVLPAINITSVQLNDKVIDHDKPIILSYSKYRLKVDYMGLYFQNPGDVKYKYKLVGHDNEWSEFTSRNSVFYNKLEDGKYTFMVKACNILGQCNLAPASFHIRIKPPFWKTYWFIILSTTLFLTFIFLYIKIRERKQIAFQQYLQEKLDERTATVMKQKEEIETKNRDITDSINYAQKIQSSILPSPKALRENFDSTFIFYEPRDIVSGDFFWYDKIGNDKMIIACADSTGHGVPGAFMSIIGTTLIKDIILKRGITSPASILEALNQEVLNTLNQNKEADKSSDGMDIIVCEVDLKTFKTRISSAMRPFVIYQGNKQLYVKGSQVTVGGNFFEEKVFKNSEFQLENGDKLYMFSDGYIDQFGGPLGKKLKMSRMLEMLDDIHDKSMEDQYAIVVDTFFDWKGKLPQVDDVLFMGIKF